MTNVEYHGLKKLRQRQRVEEEENKRHKYIKKDTTLYTYHIRLLKSATL